MVVDFDIDLFMSAWFLDSELSTCFILNQELNLQNCENLLITMQL